MAYNSQKGRGINDLFGTLNRAFTPVLESVADVGANVATGLVGDLLSGKSPKASIKDTGNRAKTMVAQRALEKLQGGSGTKRKRSSSKSSKKRKQTGGRIFPPPVHYPAGNYPGYDMIGRGIFQKMRNALGKDCEDLYRRRQQKGGRVRKRKSKKQKGGGKKRKQKGSGKQTGAGKKRKRRTGKSRKQTGDGLWSGIKEIFQ